MPDENALEPGRAKRRLTDQLRKAEAARPTFPFLGSSESDPAQLAEDAERLRAWEEETAAVIDEEARNECRCSSSSASRTLLLLRTIPKAANPPTYLQLSQYHQDLVSARRAIIRQL